MRFNAEYFFEPADDFVFRSFEPIAPNIVFIGSLFQIVEIQAALRSGTLPKRPWFRSSRVVNDDGFTSFLGMLDSVLGREVIPFGQLFDSAAAHDIDNILVLELYLFSYRDSCFA